MDVGVVGDAGEPGDGDDAFFPVAVVDGEAEPLELSLDGTDEPAVPLGGVGRLVFAGQRRERLRIR